MKEYQVTLFSDKGYKPVSTIVKYEGTDAKELKRKGIEKICIKRYWNSRDLKNYGYTKVSTRVYDKEKIEKENQERYEKIKEERGWK